jgi:hypothetical protein
LAYFSNLSLPNFHGGGQKDSIATQCLYRDKVVIPYVNKKDLIQGEG